METEMRTLLLGISARLDNLENQKSFGKSKVPKMPTYKAKKAKVQTQKNAITKARAESEKWFAKKGIEIVERNFKVELATKNGTKVYDAVKFDNGKTGVYVYGGKVLKYAWA